jgi:aspartate-semialdehyde dehydrogenase
MYFEENGYKKMKLVRETQKILDDKTIAVTAAAVLIVGGHRQKR